MEDSREQLMPEWPKLVSMMMMNNTYTMAQEYGVCSRTSQKSDWARAREDPEREREKERERERMKGA